MLLARRANFSAKVTVGLENMAKNIVQAWLGDNFYQLAPELQQIHTKGGVLVGEIDVILGTGISKFIGQRLAKNSISLVPAKCS